MIYFQVNKKQEIEGYELRTMTGDIVSFTPSYSEPLPEPFSNLHVKCEINASGGNGTPDNPNPINGYTELNIQRCGVNLWDEQWEYGGINGTTGANNNESGCIRSKNYIRVYPNQTLYFKAPTTWTAHSVRGRCYKADGTYLQSLSFYDNTVFTIPADCYLFRFVTPSGADVTTYGNDISILYPSDTTPEYHAYNGTTYTIAFGQTVYGGVLDVTRGKLRVTWANLTFAELSTKGWNISGSGIFYLYPIATAMPDIHLPIVNNPRCSSFAYQPSGTMENNTFRISDALYVKTDEAATVSDFKTWLANNTGLFAYELATPVEIDLTPQQIEALLGVNNVWHDGNGNTEVTCLI